MADPDQTTLSKQKTLQASCPADLPIEDSGIEPQGIKISFPRVIKATAPHADILSIGDTNHYNHKIRALTGTDEFLKQVKQSGITHFGVEVSYEMQYLINKFNRDEISIKEFEYHIDQSLMVSQGNELGQWTKQLVKTADFAKRNGISFEFWNPDNGVHFCDPNSPNYKECDIKKWKERFQDKELADYLNTTIAPNSGRKGLIVYGAGHFSVDNGTRDRIEGRIVKIDIYASRAQYEEALTGNLRASARDGINLNQIKPDFVYFTDTGTLHATCATSPALRAAVETEALMERLQPSPSGTSAPAASPQTPAVRHTPAQPLP